MTSAFERIMAMQVQQQADHAKLAAEQMAMQIRQQADHARLAAEQRAQDRERFERLERHLAAPARPARADKPTHVEKLRLETVPRWPPAQHEPDCPYYIWAESFTVAMGLIGTTQAGARLGPTSTRPLGNPPCPRHL